MPKKRDHNQSDLPGIGFKVPTAFVPTLKITQPDGSVLIKPGKIVILPDDDEIGAVEAARILGLSARHVESLFSQGDFKTAHKPGGRPKSQWRVQRAEILARKHKSPFE